MYKFGKKEERSSLSDYVLVRNMLRADPKSVTLTLIDFATDLSINRVEKEEDINLLSSAVKLLIANSCEPKQDSGLVLPQISTDCNTYHIHAIDVNSLTVYEHCQLKVDVSLIRSFRKNF